MDCRKIEFLPQKSQERIKKALGVFVPEVLWRILAFALYLFGAKRKVVSELVGMPEESVKTTIRVVLSDGFTGFLDRRRSKSEATSFPQTIKPTTTQARICVHRDSEWIVIDLGLNGGKLRIPTAHKIQVRTVLLSLLNSDLLSTHEAATTLEISEAHCRELAKKLASDDVNEALYDKRRGQTKDYHVRQAQKTEIIQQFAARVVTGHSTSSDVLAKLVNEQTQSDLSSRTVRWHMNKLGLTSIKKTLPELVNTLKKNS